MVYAVAVVDREANGLNFHKEPVGKFEKRHVLNPITIGCERVMDPPKVGSNGLLELVGG
jgi:hypothetical protein